MIYPVRTVSKTVKYEQRHKVRKSARLIRSSPWWLASLCAGTVAQHGISVMKTDMVPRQTHTHSVA